MSVELSDEDHTKLVEVCDEISRFGDELTEIAANYRAAFHELGEDTDDAEMQALDKLAATLESIAEDVGGAGGDLYELLFPREKQP